MIQRRQAVRTLALACLPAYLGWNVWFIVQGQVPPSILYGTTGWPAPTTGGTRAMLALFAGDFATYARMNPFAVLFVLLLGASAWALLRRGALGRTLSVGWLGVLASAWVWQSGQHLLGRL